jgi:CheY-like chemotaxis protein
LHKTELAGVQPRSLLHRPIEATPDPHCGIALAHRMRAGGGMRQRVLIVDDNEDVRRILARRLTLAGFDVAAAADGREGLAVLRGGQWDLVLLDLMMPEIDGFEFLAQLQTQGTAPPVVVITQYDDPANRTRALALGATSYVGKTHALGRSFAGTLRTYFNTRRF